MMKRCYFLGTEVFDTTLADKIVEELERLAADDDKLELWFFYLHHPFVLICLDLAVLLKSRYPDKDIKIIRIFDPTKDQKTTEMHVASCPRCILDENRYSAFMGEGSAQKKNQYVQQANKVERWILKQCDIVIAYHYPNLPDPINAQIEYAKRLRSVVVIEIFEKETKRLIDQFADHLSNKRSQEILYLLNSGKARQEIAQMMGVSVNRISQIAHEAGVEIRRDLRAQYAQKKVESRERVKRCWAIGLDKDTVSAKLSNFESLLTFLIDCYDIKEFWIDEQSCDTIYGIILAKCVSRVYNMKIKVIVCSSEAKSSLYRYMSVLLSSSSDIGNDYKSKALEGACNEAVLRCDCLITDFSSKTAVAIRRFCAEDRNIRLFDISMEAALIDERCIQ